MSLKDENLKFLRIAITNLKDYKTDIALDLLKIFSERAERFKEYLSYDQANLVNRHIEDLKKVAMAPRIKNKIYLISEIERILLISLSISDFEIKQLVDIVSIYGDVFDIHPDHITTLYIFDKGNIVLQRDLYTNTFNAIVRYFNDQNLIIPYDIKEYDKFYDIFWWKILS